MERLVIFGKGGIGKSTIAANLSATYALGGLKILHVGCDPKHDSSTGLIPGGDIETFMERQVRAQAAAGRPDWWSTEDIIMKGRLGVDCVEAGGPEPGVGCAGRGISVMLDAFQKSDLMVKGAYDLCVFDVLGDVVCGGFATPLRQGYAEKVLIVTSEELMSMYAANNIAKAVVNYHSNGVYLAGIIANLRDFQVDRERLERFAKQIGTRIIGFIPRDKSVREAEFDGTKTAVEFAPNSAFTQSLKRLSEKLISIRREDCPIPTPLEDRAFYRIWRDDRAPAAHGRGPRDSPGCGSGCGSCGGGHESKATASLEGKRLLAGPKARTALARAMGLPAAGEGPPGWTLDRAEAVWPERLKLSLRKDAAKLAFHVKPADAKEALVRTAEFSLCFEGARASPGVERLLKAVGRRLDGRSLADLFCVVADDQDTSDAAAAPSAADPYPGIGGPAGSHAQGWCNFFCRSDFEHALNEPILGDNILFVEIGDRECFYSRPQLDPRKWTFLNYPCNALTDGDKASGPVAEIHDNDVIMGTKTRMDDLVEAVGREPRKGDVVFINHLCTPILIGDDLDSLGRRCEEATGRKAVHITRDSKADSDPFSVVLHRARADPGFLRVPQDPRAVNLYDFPRRYLDEEILPLLDAMGLRANACLLPKIEFAPMERLMAGSAQITWKNSYWEKTLRGLLGDLPRPFITTPSPYGIEGAKACARAIAEAKGRLDGFERIWSEKGRHDPEAWDKLTRQARDHRLAFVASRSTLEKMGDSDFWGGIPMLPALDEMGFSVDILLYDPEKAGPGTFATPAELAKELKAGGFAAVYSDIFFDWRITAAGKAQFSQRCFEMGVGGAFRTLRRLLSLCRLPFYRRYSGWLQRATADAGR